MKKIYLLPFYFTSVNSKPNQEINKPLELPVVAWRPKIRPLNAQNYYMSVVEKKDRFYKFFFLSDLFQNQVPNRIIIKHE